MRVLAYVLPCLAMMAVGRPWAGLASLLLQLTLVGWLPAALWASHALDQHETQRKLSLAFAERDQSVPISGPWTRRGIRLP